MGRAGLPFHTSCSHWLELWKAPKKNNSTLTQCWISACEGSQGFTSKPCGGQLSTKFLIKLLYLRSVSRITTDIRAAVKDSSWPMPARKSKPSEALDQIKNIFPATRVGNALAGVCREVDGPYPVLWDFHPSRQLLPLPRDVSLCFARIHGPSQAGFAKHDAITRSRDCSRSNAAEPCSKCLTSWLKY